MGLSRLLCAFLMTACCCCGYAAGETLSLHKTPRLRSSECVECSEVLLPNHERGALGVPGVAEQPEPELVEVEVGSTALLKCGPSHSQGNFSHVINWFSVHKEKPTLIFRVYQGHGQSEPGEYQHRLSLQDKGTTLALTHVTPHDEHIFLCQGKHPWSQEHRFQLRVYKAPEEPSIQANALGISVNSREPEEVATCVGRNGYPIPQVIWYKNGRPLKEEKNRVHIQSSQIVESSGLYTVQSILKAQLLKEDKDAQFYCELNYRLPSGNHMKESGEVSVPVFYPAEKVWLEVEPVGMLKEGDHVEIRCLADGNPSPHFSISKQNLSTREVVEEAVDDNGVLVLKSAHKEHSGLYECQGLDLETMALLSSDQQELLVNYVSDVWVSPAAPESQEGSNLTLTCGAESNQALEFQWLREKTGKVLGKGPVLQLHNLNRKAGGGYRCVASVPSVPGLNSTQLINVVILDSNRTTALITTVSPYAKANSTSTEKKLSEPKSKGVVIVAVTVCLLVLAVLGAVLYFFYKKGKLPCGRSGKQEITLPPSRKSEFVVEVKSDKRPEDMSLLQGSNGGTRAPGDQHSGWSPMSLKWMTEKTPTPAYLQTTFQRAKGLGPEPY
ncbi:cell surface glycoprotein MUC18 isoform X7 [Sturnira hondurensis]|uniref:cell surface glycoprotein MUC18 isoform X7 n=1 Tax=Sturnira hondurensis TaxID=192404 RepID=UPI0018790797|nr:cell surface glycoprotein MUC18 isoform X7 [Sturnira hondurensis]